VLLRWFLPGGLEALSIARRARVPLVVTAHGYDVTVLAESPSVQGRWLRRGLQDLIAGVHTFIAVSGFIRDRLVGLGVPAAKIRVLYNGVPMPNLSLATSPAHGVIFVGRLVEKKGVDHLLAALATLPANMLRRPIRIIGDGPLRAHLTRLAISYQLEVEFLGQLPSRRVMELMAASEVVVVPSRTATDGDSEGLPTVVLEAAALGKPVLATRHAGIPEAVLEGRTGLLVDEHDVNGLARGLRSLLQDPQLARTIGAAARDHARDHFDIRRCTALIEDCYDEIGDSRAIG
jgi:glycosyltransferase involved in cell wall biosynthesis